MKIRIILAYLGFTLMLTSASPALAGQIVGIGGLCLDIKGGAGKGNPVIVYSCRSGALNQTWYRHANEIRSADGYCLDQKGGEGQGNKVIAWPCHNKANQQWRWFNDGTIRTNSGNFCLDVRGGKAVSGAEVILWPCKSGAANQRWKFRGPSG